MGKAGRKEKAPDVSLPVIRTESISFAEMASRKGCSRADMVVCIRNRNNVLEVQCSDT